MSIVIYWLHSFHFFSFSYVLTLYFKMSLHIIDLKFSHIYFIPSRLRLNIGINGESFLTFLYSVFILYLFFHCNVVISPSLSTLIILK